jgi:hypothetical protein
MSRYLTEKCRVVESLGFCGFACVLEGVLEKRMVACGVFVVDCVANVDTKTFLVGCRKMGQGLQVYFRWKRWAGGIPKAAEASYRGLDMVFGKDHTMETFYVALAFLMMVALPLLISRRGGADRDALHSSGVRRSNFRSTGL